MSHDPKRHIRKWAVLSRLVASSDVVCIQETHALDATASDSTTRFSPTHRALLSEGRPGQAGGLITLVRHSLLSAAEVSTTTFQEGRVHAVRVACPTLKEGVVLINIHNYDVLATTLPRLSNCVM